MPDILAAWLRLLSGYAGFAGWLSRLRCLAGYFVCVEL
jgi:hypothetical protein